MFLAHCYAVARVFGRVFSSELHADFSTLLKCGLGLHPLAV